MKINGFFQAAALVLALFLGFSACKSGAKGNEALKMIPKEAFMVGTFNPKKLMDKADYASAIKLEMVQENIGDIKQREPLAAKVLENPAESGINLADNIYFYLKNSAEKEDDPSLIILANLAAIDKFEALVKGNKRAEIKTSGAVKYSLSGDETLVVWSDKQAALVLGKEAKNPKPEQFLQQAEQSIASNNSLTKAFSKDNDFDVWLSSDEFAQSLLDGNVGLEQQMAMFDLTKEDLKGNVAHLHANFLNGETEGAFGLDLSKGLAKATRPFFRDGLTNDLSKYLPAKNHVMVLTFAPGIEGIVNLLTERGLSMMADQQLKAFGVRVGDFKEITNGDLAFVVYQDSTAAATPPFAMAVNIKDKKQLDKALAVVVAEGGLKKEGNRYVYTPMTSPSMDEMMEQIEQGKSVDELMEKKGAPIYFLLLDKVLVVSGIESVITQAEKGGFAASEAIPADLYKQLSTKVMGAFVNYSAMKQQSGVGMAGMLFTGGMMGAGSAFSNILSEGYTFATDNGISTRVLLKEKGKNSLRVMIEDANRLYLEAKKEMKKFEQDLEQEAESEETK